VNETVQGFERAMRRLRPTREREAREDAALSAYLAAKYRADEPRVPAGNPDGGQWAGAAGSRAQPGARTLLAARRGGRRLSEAECWAQYERDVFQCKMVGLPQCYAQAS
jgi:hypothetical protein